MKTMSMFEERPRKVHLFHDQKGATFGLKNELFADTLCKMNSRSPQMQVTSDPAKVTCKICLRDHRFRARGLPNPAPVVKSLGGQRTRYRRNWRGQLVLQVEVSHLSVDDRDPRDLGQTVMRWRDATLEDLGVGVV